MAVAANQLLTLTINGIARSLAASEERLLLEVLREDLRLTGAKPGGGEGVCGACTVLIDGQATRACVTRATDAAGTAGTAGTAGPLSRVFRAKGRCIPSRRHQRRELDRAGR
jgi:hypothetical protein